MHFGKFELNPSSGLGGKALHTRILYIDILYSGLNYLIDCVHNTFSCQSITTFTKDRLEVGVYKLFFIKVVLAIPTIMQSSNV